MIAAQNDINDVRTVTRYGLDDFLAEFFVNFHEFLAGSGCLKQK